MSSKLEALDNWNTTKEELKMMAILRAIKKMVHKHDEIKCQIC